ncbi:MAG: SAM-dependent methyltransferase [Halanaerobiales bacterium]
MEANNKGKVYIVGAGPGDRKLLTLRGREALKRADIVLCDRLIDPSLPALYSPQADNISVHQSLHS